MDLLEAMKEEAALLGRKLKQLNAMILSYASDKPAKKTRKTGGMSPKGRAAVARAQKKRWAKVRAAKKAAKSS